MWQDVAGTRDYCTSLYQNIKLKSYKTVVTVGTLEKWKRRPKPRQSGRRFASSCNKTAAPAVNAFAKSESRKKSIHFFHAIHNPSTIIAKEKPGPTVKNRAKCAVYPPSISVSLFSSLFKSLSVLRASVILSTECSTVVWCLPPNCRPISGSDASVSCFARYIAIWRG
jgi:hypothetical protein